MSQERQRRAEVRRIGVQDLLGGARRTVAPEAVVLAQQPSAQLPIIVRFVLDVIDEELLAFSYVASGRHVKNLLVSLRADNNAKEDAKAEDKPALE